MASLSLAGIADASAANYGTAQTQTGNNHTVQKTTKVQAKHIKYVKKQTKAYKKVYKKLKRVKKTASSKKLTTHKVNKRKSKSVTTKKYRVYKKWYKYHGKWRYKTVYKYKKSKSKPTHKLVKSASSTTYSKEEAAAGSKKRVKRYKKSAGNSSVKRLARSLSKGTRSQYQKGSKIFSWVKRNIAYKFYYNTRYGATGTLKYRKGNCADTAHLVVALSRSAGLQAKYAHGKVRFRSGKVYGHVWALVKVNGKWYKADASNDRNSFGRMGGKVVRLKGIYNRLPF